MPIEYQRRNELLKDALCVLLAAKLEETLIPVPELGLWDDEVIEQYELRIQALIDNIPGEYGQVFTELAYKLELDARAIGANRSVAHALAVEVAHQTLSVWSREEHG